MTKTALLEPRFVDIIASEVGCRPHQAQAASELFAEGATVPFVARYRKEQTGGMDEVVLRTLIERRDELVELEMRRATILRTIGEQGVDNPSGVPNLGAAPAGGQRVGTYSGFA